MQHLRVTSQLPLRSLTVMLLALFGLAALGGHLYLLKPSYKALGAVEDELFVERRGRPHDVPGAERFSAVESEIETLRQQLGGDGAELAANELVAFVIGRLDASASERRVHLTSVEPGSTMQVLEFDEVPIHRS